MFDFVFCFRLNIFTSKISNLLLSLGDKRAEGTRSSECYAQSIIYSINISKITFNDLFVYFVVVVFPLFGASIDLINMKFTKAL